MENILPSHEEQNPETSKLAGRFSLYSGLGLMLAFIGYVIYLMVTSFELPDGGEILDLAAVTLVMFGLGWAGARIGAHLISRLRVRMLAGR
jgi:hypothetical protein